MTKRQTGNSLTISAFWLGALVGLSFCPQLHAKTINIHAGGFLVSESKKINQIGDEHVRLMGICISSCTMWLGVKNVCIGKYSVFGFHGAVNTKGPNAGKPSSKIVNDFFSSHFPPNIRKKFNEAWSKSLKLTWVTASELKELEPRLEYCK